MNIIPISSYLSILRPTLAVPDFKKALDLDPTSKPVQAQLAATKKLIYAIEFEKVSPARPACWLLADY